MMKVENIDVEAGEEELDFIKEAIQKVFGDMRKNVQVFVSAQEQGLNPEKKDFQEATLTLHFCQMKT